MDELPPVLAPHPEPPPLASTSLGARLLNVFAMPGQVFAEVQASPAHVLNWLIPMVLCVVVSAFSANLTISHPRIQKQFIESQTKLLDHSVAAGKMSRADADKWVPLMRQVMVPMVTAGAAFFGMARVFWWAFILWLLGRALLKARFDYHKALEIAGLAFLISVLGEVVTVLLTADLGQFFASPYQAFSAVDLQALQNSRVVMGAINVFTFWFIGVLSVGLARLSGAPFFRAAWLVSACWVLQTCLLLTIGLGQYAF